MPHHPDRSTHSRRRDDTVRGAFDKPSTRSLAGYDRLPLTDVEDHERPQVSHNRIARLREFGFAELVKMMTSRPAIPVLSIYNMSGKIAELGELGVADPVKMITSRPAILELASDNIRGKIADTSRASSLRSPLPSR